MNLRRPIASALAGVAAVLALAAPAQALYLFFLRVDLDHAIRERPDSVIGKQVVFTDELCVIWPEAQERPNTVDGTKHVLFDTTYFHCAIPQDKVETYLNEVWADAQKGYGEALKQLQEVNDQLLEEHRQGRAGDEAGAQAKRKELYWELYRVWRNKPIATVYGTVTRADFWGPVMGKDNGVATEAITIVVDRVERPRERWYEFGLDAN